MKTRIAETVLLASCLLMLLGCQASEPAALPAGPDTLAATLAMVKAHSDPKVNYRGASPNLTKAKHQLRDWLDQQFATATENDLTEQIVGPINGVLRQRELICGWGSSTCGTNADQGMWDYLGGLAPVKIWRSGSIAVVKTSFGIQCGFDDSIYGYGWNGRNWHRLFAYEQDDYVDAKHYAPQTVTEVLIAPRGSELPGDSLVLSMGEGSWCSSFWVGVHYQLHAVDAAAGTGKVLLDERADGYVGDDKPIAGSLLPNAMQVSFIGEGMDGRTIPFRNVIRRYELDGDRLVRVQPVAPSVDDFIQEWISEKWDEAVFWTAADKRAELKAWHAKFHNPKRMPIWNSSRLQSLDDDLEGSPEFLSYETESDAVPCEADANLWSSRAVASGDKSVEKTVYFLIRKTGEQQFRMEDISGSPLKGCVQQ